MCYDSFVLNVANLKQQFFQAVADHRKDYEYRIRSKPDARLDAIRPGEPIALLECGSRRVILATITAFDRMYSVGEYVYQIRISRKRQLIETPISLKKIQGWHRRQKLF